ncbi:MAG: hypothetical protein RL410_673 [Actinomycetota bacterium]|jgi:3'(2'), 5'-bisphosphate nucleotidase
MNDHELAVFLADTAGKRLIALRNETEIDFSDRAATAAFEKVADKAANDYLIEQLKSLRPGDSILSEESPDSEVRLSANRVWIIDPVDGTKEYSRNEPEFAVHVALWQSGALIAAAIAIPNHDFVWSTLDAPLQVHAQEIDRPLMIVASHRETAATIERLERHLSHYADEHGFAGVAVMHCGSVGGKVHQLLAGVGDVYVSSVGFYEWDSAAPTAVALHHGFAVSDFSGAQLTFNAMPPKTDSYIVTHPWLYETVLHAMQDVQ